MMSNQHLVKIARGNEPVRVNVDPYVDPYP